MACVSLKRYFISLLLLPLLWLQSCEGQVPEALESAAFAAKATEEGVEVLDVRTPEEYAEGHWPSARLMDYDGGEFSEEKAGLDKEKTYLIYCRTTRRSTAAALELAEMGITAYILDQGYFSLEPLQ
jgi:rhodanese-related sulfurtransferase